MELELMKQTQRKLDCNQQQQPTRCLLCTDTQTHHWVGDLIRPSGRSDVQIYTKAGAKISSYVADVWRLTSGATALGSVNVHVVPEVKKVTFDPAS